MSTYTKQLLKDTTTETVIKFVGVIDAGGQPFTDPANTTLVVSNLRGAYDTNNQLRSVTGNTPLNFYGVNIREVSWSLATNPSNSNIQLVWRGSSANSVAFNMAYGPGEFDFESSAAVVSSDAVGVASANCGELFVSANGILNGAYTVVVTIRKNPQYFDRGALVDKSYFQNP
jgi:hypothetical protein